MRKRAPVRGQTAWIVGMTFKYSFTLPISGANKLPRFRTWAAQHVPHIEVNLPPQVPVRSETLTVRLRSPEARKELASKLEGVEL